MTKITVDVAEGTAGIFFFLKKKFHLDESISISWSIPIAEGHMGRMNIGTRNSNRGFLAIEHRKNLHNQGLVIGI